VICRSRRIERFERCNYILSPCIPQAFSSRETLYFGRHPEKSFAFFEKHMKHAVDRKKGVAEERAVV
jgi:hypothetical protein